MGDAAEFSPVAEKIKSGKRFIVVAHVSPEGDAVGALLGLALGLRSIGKEVVAYLEDPVPELYGYLPGQETIVHTLAGEAPVDATFAVDCGQLTRLGKGFVDFKGRGTLINIDHHATNDRFGDINVIFPEASAAGEMVYDLLKYAGIKITKPIADNLYTAIHTDTGSFRYSSATPSAFAAAGELVAAGADPWEISKRVYENYPEKRFRILSKVLSTLEMKLGGKVAIMHVTLDMLKSTNSDKDTVDGFVNYARSIEGVEIGVFFRQSAKGGYKVSLRSKGVVNVASLSETFGGGGHAHAAGFNLDGDLDAAKEKVLKALEPLVKAA